MASEEVNGIELWRGPEVADIDEATSQVSEIAERALNLSRKQQVHIASAFNMEAYEMGSEYIWKKTVVLLREILSDLGIKFIGELLGRDDIDESTDVNSVLTDYATIELAEKLGVINPTGAMKLRHAHEILAHFFSRNIDDELDRDSAAYIHRTCIKYVLGIETPDVAVEFTNFRRRLIGETLTIQDQEVEWLLGTTLFFLRTILTILLWTIKTDRGANLERAIENLNLLLPRIWGKLAEKDKWSVGSAYKDVTADGRSQAAAGLKSALLKVSGFDFVPESLRSDTFISFARKVIETHHGYNNFYNEPKAVTQLAKLGSIIPRPALAQCIQAYLVVIMGNRFGVSADAVEVAKVELSTIPPDVWEEYFQSMIQVDEEVLQKSGESQLQRLNEFLFENQLTDFLDLGRYNQELYDSVIKKDFDRAAKICKAMYVRLKPF